MVLTVMGRQIVIEEVTQARLNQTGNDVDVIGHYDPMSQTVFVLETLTPQKKKEVLVHELTHAVFHISGLTNLLESNLEEAVCDALENLAGYFNI